MAKQILFAASVTTCLLTGANASAVPRSAATADFVSNLQLPDSLPLASLPKAARSGRSLSTITTTEAPSAKRVDGALASFVGGLSDEVQTDVINSLLLAQLAANEAYDSKAETPQWYSKFVSVLSNIGWVTDSFKFQKYTGSLSQGEMVLQTLTDALEHEGGPSSEIQVLQATIKGVQDLENDLTQPVCWFCTESATLAEHWRTPVNYQVGVVNTQNDDPTVMLGAFYFTAMESKANDPLLNSTNSSSSSDVFVNRTYSSSSSNLFYATQRMTLDMAIYPAAAVAQKLGVDRNNLVYNLTI